MSIFRCARGVTLLQLLAVSGVSGIVLYGSMCQWSEQEIRARVTETRMNFASLAAGLEAYQTDWGIYPYDGYNYDSGGWHPYRYYWYPPIELTTPVSYVSSDAFTDPFRAVPPEPRWRSTDLRYFNTQSTWGDVYDHLQRGGTSVSTYLDEVLEEFGNWRLGGQGPDQLYGPTGWEGISGYPSGSLPLPYDPTNGACSDGDLMRSELSPVGYLNIPQEE